MTKLEVASYKGNRKPLWLKTLIALIAAGILVFAGLAGAVAFGARDQVSGNPKVMIILGCQVMESGPSQLLRDRLDEALVYLEQSPDMTVVVSGSQGSNEPATEASVMAEYLMDRGVAEDAILLEEDSHNTDENLRFSMALLREEGVDLSDGVVIVSNGFHLTRARMLAGRAGFEAVSTLAAPTTHLPSALYMYVREPLALAKSLVFDR